ncbi:MAG: YcfL family protein [Verrucomicrobia bacterium]|nr:YcfL family protein [Verrucomicrobiota bacterium]
MNPKPVILATALATVALFAGCATVEPGPFRPLDTTKFTLENTDKFVLLDQPAQYSVTCTGLQERTLGDGRLEVVANVKNRESRRIQVQINCVFKDELGYSTADETPFQTLILSENATEAVHFTAMNTKAKKYTIRVRQAR